MGVLVSLTLAVCGLLITLILAVQYALAMSVLKKGALTNLKVKMRPGDLFAPIVLFFFFYLPVIA
jgi:hypothetical protein